MNPQTFLFLTSLFACLIFSGNSANASCSPSQKARGIDLLRQNSPDGYRIYQNDPKDFMNPTWWTECESIVDTVVVALHETVHHQSMDKYPLINGQKLPYLKDTGLPSPSAVAGLFPNDRFRELYLKRMNDSQSSASNFSILLDEFNAYTHGLNTANKLAKFDQSFQWRAGVLAMMSYTKAYLSLARASQGWNQLMNPANRDIISKIWSQAERVLAESCRNPITPEDRSYFPSLCQQSNAGAISQIIGRQPYCPKDCGSGREGVPPEPMQSLAKEDLPTPPRPPQPQSGSQFMINPGIATTAR